MIIIITVIVIIIMIRVFATPYTRQTLQSTQLPDPTQLEKRGFPGLGDHNDHVDHNGDVDDDGDGDDDDDDDYD